VAQLRARTIKLSMPQQCTQPPPSPSPVQQHMLVDAAEAGTTVHWWGCCQGQGQEEEVGQQEAERFSGVRKAWLPHWRPCLAVCCAVLQCKFLVCRG